MTDTSNANREAAKYRARLREEEQKAEKLSADLELARKNEAAIAKKNEELRRQNDEARLLAKQSQKFGELAARLDGNKALAVLVLEEGNRAKAPVLNSDLNINEDRFQDTLTAISHSIAHARIGKAGVERAKKALANDPTRTPSPDEKSGHGPTRPHDVDWANAIQSTLKGIDESRRSSS